MGGLTEKTVIYALREVIEAESGQDIVSAGRVKGLSLKDGAVGFVLEVSGSDQGDRIKALAEARLKATQGVTGVTIVLTSQRKRQARGEGPAAPTLQRAAPDPPQLSPPGPPSLAKVGSIIAVASGKGGVGKSTTAVNLALALQALGHSVGILDADIYGPSVPTLLGLSGSPQPQGEKILPMEGYGLRAMSIGLLLPKNGPVIWRGPIVAGAIKQLLAEVVWGELDYLVIDLPPGTGDVQLSLVQNVPLAGAVIVSTPQDLALIDARKGLEMFKRVEVPVLGIVENMSGFVCPACGEETAIFDRGGARRIAEEMGTAFLGEVPLDLAIRLSSDAGHPIVAAEPDSPQAKAYMTIATAVLGQLEEGAKASTG
ncbi:MAG: Mrp/NBP35 family ATP-binding protein [Sphingomonadales bacterium]